MFPVPFVVTNLFAVGTDRNDPPQDFNLIKDSLEFGDQFLSFILCQFACRDILNNADNELWVVAFIPDKGYGDPGSPGRFYG